MHAEPARILAPSRGPTAVRLPATLARRPAPSRAARLSGFTVIEVVVALLIFVIGAVAIMRIFPPSLNIIDESGRRSIGTRLASNTVKDYTSNVNYVPDTVYDADWNQAGGTWTWTDFVGAPSATRHRGISLPSSIDQFDNAATGHFRHVNAERQAVQVKKDWVTKSNLLLAFTNFPVDDTGKVDVYREDKVSGVTVLPDGRLDFVNATDSLSTNNEFREPIVSVADAGSVLEGDSGTKTLTFQVTLEFAVNVPVKVDYATVVPGVPPASSGADLANFGGDNDYTPASGTLTFPPTTTGPQTVTVTVNGDTTQEQSEWLYLQLSNGVNCSIRDTGSFHSIASGVILNDDFPAVTAPTPTPTPNGPGANPWVEPQVTDPVRPPQFLRDGVTYYVSYSWANGATTAGGAKDEPLVFPVTDWATSGPGNAGKVLRAWTTAGAGQTIQGSSGGTGVTLWFRQHVGSIVQSVGLTPSVALDMTAVPGFNDAFGNPRSLSATAPYNQVSLDYNVYDWRWLVDDGYQLHDIYPSNAPASVVPPPPANLRNTREAILPVRHILGPVYRDLEGTDSGGQQWYHLLDPATLDPTLPTVKQQLKEGRIPFDVSDPMNPAQNLTLTKATTLYRSVEGWGRQISVAAESYVPFYDAADFTGGARPVVNTAWPQENWREYYWVAGGGTPPSGILYFHPSEAGKRILVTNAAGTATIDIDDNIIPAPAGVPATFAVSGQVAQSLTSTLQPISVAGADWLVRSLWPNNDRYQQIGLTSNRLANFPWS